MRKLSKDYPSKKLGLMKNKKAEEHSSLKTTKEILQQSIMCNCALAYIYLCVQRGHVCAHTEWGKKQSS